MCSVVCMTKTKADKKPPGYAHLPKSARNRTDMDSEDGSSNARSSQMPRHALHVTTQQTLVSAQKVVSEVSSQAKHKDVHSQPPCRRSSASTAATRHTASGGKEVKPERGKRSENALRSAPGTQKHRIKLSVPIKLSDAQDTSPDCSAVNLSSTDSSSETSDCTEENKIPSIAQSIDIIEMSNGETDRERKSDSREKLSEFTDKCSNFHSSVDNTTVTPALGFEDRSISPGEERSLISFDSRLNTSASATFSDLTGDVDSLHKDLLREIDDLRSENEYLKDEVEELRSEVLEMRDVYTEEDVHHLQELRQQLDQANKACRILQYRLRKAERRSLRVAQTGQVDGELIRTLEHDIRVAKSVSLRLHGELEVVQKKNVQLEQENEGLREQLQNLEVTKQVLQTELDKSRENSLRRRSLRSTTSKSEKVSLPDDSADLICQLHFAKEELSLMCKKLAKTAMECESMREELARYRLLYGDVDASQAAAGTTNSAHTREAEVKVHLRLVEEEATLLSRRIVELEVENRGLRAEMSELQERAGRSQEDEDELMEAAGECLDVPKGGTSSEYCGFEERTGSHEHSEGVVAEDCPVGQNLREGPVGLDRQVLEGQVKSAESPERGRKVPCEETCNLSLKDQEAILAIHDQATLVRSAVEFLTTPAKNGLSPTSVCSFPYFSKVDAQCKSLTYGLEVLQEQLRTLVAKVETLVKSELTDHKSKSTSSDKSEDTNIEPVLLTDKQVAQQCPIEEVVHVSSHTWEQTGKQDSLVLMALQLRCFLQQWRHGERPTAECKSMFEMDFQKDLYCQMEAELHGSKKTCKTHQQCHNQVCRNLLSNLRAALQDLGCELQQEYLDSQHIAQQFAQAKASWTVECTELKCLIGKLERTSDNVETKGSPDLNTALQKDHVEKLQQRLAESYAAVMNMSQQLKVCERNWKCERQEFLKRLNQACQDWHKLSNTKVSYGFRTHQIGEETTRKCSLHMVDPKPAKSEQMSNKNWIYLTQEAALIDREGPCKTWDCSIMPSSFPGLTIKKETGQKSHTAPEQTSLRIYYSPPSARRIHLYAEKLDADKYERPAEKQERCCSHSPQEHIRGNIASDYDSRQGTLPFECQCAAESDLSAFARSSTSGFQPFDSSFPPCLPFSGLEVTANLSDDMKEITANVLQSSYPEPLDRGKWRGSGNHIVEVVSTGTQTHALPQVNSVAVQTEGRPDVFAGKHWSPRVTSFVSGRHQQMPTPLERVPGLSERSCLSSTSPKLQQIHSASSPFSPTSLTSNSSNSSTLSTLSSSSSSTNFSRLDVPKDHGLWVLPHNSSGSSAFAHSSSTRSSSASGGGSEKPAGRKSMRIHKYGLVQEFFHNVCGRGEKPKSRGEKAPVVRRDHVGQAKLKKTEGPPSRIPTVQPVRSDSVTKIVNRRFIKQGPKDELRPGQTQSQSECQCQNSKTSLSKDKCRGPVTLEDRSCDCRCRTLSSCFARASCTNLHRARGHCKLHPHRCPMAAGGKEDLLSL